MPILFLAFGGAFGALSRHFVGASVMHWTGLKPHWGTFVVNITGCLLMGFFATFIGLRFQGSVAVRYFFFTGFLGAYTTFSTYMLENFLLLEGGKIWLGLFNMIGSVVVGILALWGGIVLARAVA